jgi:hypothetical protein
LHSISKINQNTELETYENEGKPAFPREAQQEIAPSTNQERRSATWTVKETISKTSEMK